MFRSNRSNLSDTSIHGEKSDNSSYWEWYKDNMSLIILVALALSGTIWGIADVFIYHSEVDASTKDPNLQVIYERVSKIRFVASLIFIVLSALSLVVGIELMTQFRRLNRHFSNDEKSFAHVQETLNNNANIIEGIRSNFQDSLPGLGGRLIYPEKIQIHNRMIDLATQAKNDIRLLIYGTDWLEFPTDEWSIKLATYLKAKNSRGDAGFTYKVVCCLQCDGANLNNFYEKLKNRFQIYKECGVSHMIDLQFINDNQPIGLNLLVIDGIHSAISFSTEGAKDVNTCVFFEHNPRISGKFKSWFDNTIYSRATKRKEIEDFLEEEKG